MNHHIAFSVISLVALSVLGSAANAARYVPIKIYLSGEVILEGNASDDGSPDADEVWDALKQVNLGETKAFKELFGDVTADAFTILKKRSEAEPPLTITIDVAYGGTATTTGLHLQRMPADGAGRVWRINPKEVSRMFRSRLIKRSDAARLSDPTRAK